MLSQIHRQTSYVFRRNERIMGQITRKEVPTTAILPLAQDRGDQRLLHEFMATLAHELRNPLGWIINAVQVAERAGTDEALTRHAWAIVERQSRHMARMIEEILDVSRSANGKLSLHLERIELATIVARAVETVSPLITSRNL